MYSLQIEEDVIKAFRKLGKKDPNQMDATNSKIEQILKDPLQFKPLRHPLEGARRVHVGSFVLIYDVTGSTVRLLKYEHHDDAYK
ncbi:MAG: type II toxin-antitoxin system mRNA interferase toxin, RelE/StbE family [Candidatus Aenigmatarchaeota archaeon]